MGLAELKQQERESRRKLILSAAQKVFAEKDFKSVTVREIAKAAEVSIGTIYNYYSNIDELFLDVFISGTEALQNLIKDEEQVDGRCSIRRLCEIYIDYLNENVTYYKMMAHFMTGGRLGPEATDRLNDVMRSLMDRIENILKVGCVGKQTRLTAHALFSALNGLMISYAQYPGRSQEEIRNHTRRLAILISEKFQPRIRERAIRTEFISDPPTKDF